MWKEIVTRHYHLKCEVKIPNVERNLYLYEVYQLESDSFFPSNSKMKLKMPLLKQSSSIFKKCN